MQWHDFVFSTHRRRWQLRHAVFWITWWFYFYGIYWYNQHIPKSNTDAFIKLGSPIFLKAFLLLFIHAFACYAFIYFLMPRYLLKSKWIGLGSGILLLGILLTASGYGLLKYIFPFIAFVFNAPTESTSTSLLWKSTSIGLLSAPKIIAAAAAIKLMKYWWLKQKEKEYLEKEKIETELQLLKAQIRPEFLFTTLNNIYAYSLARSVRAPDMLMKLSDLLSYMLYECEAPVVSAEKEIEMMKQYMVLEKIRQNERLDLEINVKGELAGKKLAPFLLLPFIENSFRQINVATEQAWLNMEIKVEGDCFLMKLVNGTQSEETAASCFQTQGLVNVQKRLTLLYPGRHELKLTKVGEMALVFLHLQLEPIEESNTFTALQKNISR